MCAMTFLDSNVFLYALDSTASSKQASARRIVSQAMTPNAPFAISSQVMAEFSSVAIRKMKLSTPIVLSLIAEMGKLRHTVIDNPLVMRAVEIQNLYGIQFYDAQIVAAAERLQCREIWSEDLNNGQTYCGMTAVNPFVDS